MNDSEHVINKYLNHPNMKELFRGRIHAGHFNQIHNYSRPFIEKAINQIRDISEDHPRFRGGSTGMGGSYYMGGKIQNPEEEGNPLHDAEHIKDHAELYHMVLDLSPKQVEMLREIAAQLLGALPSSMWGSMVSEHEKLESEPRNYDHIIRMPNSHAMARMVEAEGNERGHGGGFGKALKHVAKLGSRIYKAGHHALKFVNRNKDLLLQIPGLDKYSDEVNAFLDSANQIDDAVNPIVDATIDAVRENATQGDKDKLKRMAEDSIKKVVEERIPKGKEIIKLAEDVRSTVNESRNRPARAR